MRRLFPAVLALAVGLLLTGTSAAQITMVPGPQKLVAQAPKFIAAADFDKDQFEDAVVSNATSNKVSVLFGQDGTSFGAAVDLAVGRVLRGIAAADLNSDGNPDITTVDFLDSRVFVVTGNGNGTFNIPVNYKTGSRPIDVGYGDLDKKQGNDVFVVNQTINRIGVLFNIGGNRGLQVPAVEFPVGKTPKRGEAKDLNGDGFDDIVVLNTGTASADDISILINKGVGDFVIPPRNFVVGAGAADFAIADVNHDRAPDILVLNAAATAVLNEFSVTVLINRTEIINGRVFGTAFFDLETPVRVNCPLTLDGLSILCNVNFIATGDFDDDTFTDFVVTFNTRPRVGSVITSGLLTAYQGHGDGTFDFSNQVNIGQNPQGVVAGDFNGDGVADTAVAEFGSRTVRIVNSLPPPKRPGGDPCNVGNQCASNFCVDGVCCGSASCPAGQFCNIKETHGVCTAPAPNGNPCDTGPQCDSQFCVNGFCCGHRTCPAGQFCNTGDCALPAPNGFPCKEGEGEQCLSTFCTNKTCCADERCPAGQSCNIPGSEGVCTLKRPDGASCTDPAQCLSAFCTDGFCCNVRVCPAGQSCGIDPSQGICRFAPTATPTSTRTPTPTPTPTQAPIGAPCVTGANCLSGNCVDGLCCTTSSCPANQFCNMFSSPGTCATRRDPPQSCRGDTDCTTSNCDGGVCAPTRTATPTRTPTPLQGGDPCSQDLQCAASLVCSSEGVCCSSRTCPSGSSCRVSGSCQLLPTATPTGKPNGARCTVNDAELCESLICNTQHDDNGIVGVCCDTDLCPDGEFCDIRGFEGQCSPPLEQGEPCNKNGDCAPGLQCLFDTETNGFICDIPRTPTPTLLPTAIPTNTAGIIVSRSRGGGCSIGSGHDASGIWILAALPFALWIRRTRLQRIHARC